MAQKQLMFGAAAQLEMKKGLTYVRPFCSEKEI